MARRNKEDYKALREELKFSRSNDADYVLKIKERNCEYVSPKKRRTGSPR